MFKKFTVIALCILMLAACGTSSAVLLPFIDTADSEVDYFGEVIHAFNTEGNIWSYSDNNTAQSEALWKRIDDIEKKLNVKIEMAYGGDEIYKLYPAQAAAGSLKTDLIYRSAGNNLRHFAKSGVLHPMTNFPQFIDLSDTDKYGMPGNLEAAMINGIPYAVQPTYWPGLQGSEWGVIAFYPDKLAAYGLPNLHEYYENGTWTWETMKELFDKAAPALDENEVLLEAHGGFLLNMLFLSNGFDFVTFVDGVPKLELMSQDALNAIDFLKELNLYGEKIEIGTSINDRGDSSTFIAGDALTVMASTQSVSVGGIAYESTSQHSIMPFPCGPDAEYGKWAQSVCRIHGLAITIGALDPDCVAHVVSELCEPFEEFGGSMDGLKEYYRQNIFNTDLDVEIFFAVDDFVRYDYDDEDLINDYTNTLAERINVDSTSELIQKNSNIVKNAYENYIEPNLTGYMIEHMDID